MDIIILGLLMMQNSTIYDVKQFVGRYLTSISGNGTGSIQTAIKKMLSKNLIICTERVENGVNKKIYSITEAGKEYFEDSLSSPMLYKEKNMELSKLFFMGFINKKKQIASIYNYIQELENELANLRVIDASLEPRYTFDKAYYDIVRKNSGAPEFITEEKLYDIAKFQYATLDLGIEKIKFEITWFKKFVSELEKEEYENEK